MNPIVLTVLYFLMLVYMFMGIAIVSDIFMEAIEMITAQTQIKQIKDEDGNIEIKEETVWNATVANLTLMALGSSAPEILLSVIETLQTLEETPGELGPSTIVGSAAFNLLVISAVSIVSVGETPKKINDMGVFAITSIMSILAYVWLYVVLKAWTPEEVTIIEAVLTLIYFVLLVTLSYAADRYNASLEDSNKTAEEIEETDRKTEIQQWRT